MIDYYLRFADENEAFLTFKEAGYTSVNQNGEEFIIPSTHTYCVDIIGTILEGGTWDYQNGEITIIEPPVAIPGYHVNVRMISGGISESLLPFVIDTPTTPYRKFW